MSYFNYRRRIALFILFLLILFAFAAASSGYWMQWAFLAASWGFLILVDFIFLTENTFVYDPNYKTWGQRTGSY